MAPGSSRGIGVAPDQVSPPSLVDVHSATPLTESTPTATHEKSVAVVVTHPTLERVIAGASPRPPGLVMPTALLQCHAAPTKWAILATP